VGSFEGFKIVAQHTLSGEAFAGKEGFRLVHFPEIYGCNDAHCKDARRYDYGCDVMFLHGLQLI
jgi:hypothetical protein